MLKQYKNLAFFGLAIGVVTCCYMPSSALAACTPAQCAAAFNACNDGKTPWNYYTDCAKWYACDTDSSKDCTNWGCTHADYRCRTGKEPFQP